MARRTLSQWVSTLLGRPPTPNLQNYPNLQKHVITSLSDLSARPRKAYVFYPSCSVYIRADGTWIFPQNVRGSFGPRVMIGPAEKVEADANALTLGEAAVAAMSRSRFEDWDGKTPWVDPKAPEAAGFKNYADLENGAALLGVGRASDSVKVSPMGATRGGGHEPVRGAERTCVDNASAIGGLILELSPLCVGRQAKRKTKVTGGNSLPGKSGSDDSPVSFGCKMSWVAVPSADGRALAGALGLKQIESCSWKVGIERGYQLEGVFITPPIDRWTIAVGSHPEIGQDAFVPYLEKLSDRFGQAFYFGTHRVVGYQAWAKAEKGKVLRAFGYLGERGEFLLNVGDRSPEELEIGMGVEDLENAPDEETVLEIASKWVLDPRELDQQPEADGTGWFGVH